MVFRVQFKGKMKDTSQRAFPDQPFQPASSARVCLDDEDAASDLVPAMSDRGIIRELRGYCPKRKLADPWGHLRALPENGDEAGNHRPFVPLLEPRRADSQDPLLRATLVKVDGGITLLEFQADG